MCCTCRGRSGPSLDAVDLPGLIAAPAALREQTRALVERRVAQRGHYSTLHALWRCFLKTANSLSPVSGEAAGPRGESAVSTDGARRASRLGLGSCLSACRTSNELWQALG